MSDHALDASKIGIGCRVRTRQDVLGVEDVEPLVLHRAHVEMADSDDVEHLQVVFATIALLVPAHGPDQRLHRVLAFVLVARLDEDPQWHLTTRGGLEPLLDGAQITGDDGEQVAGLGKGVVPIHAEPAIVEPLFAGRVTVG